MLVFNLLEILFSWCYWDRQLPGSPGCVAGDSALRTNSLPQREGLVQVQSFPKGLTFWRHGGLSWPGPLSP